MAETSKSVNNHDVVGIWDRLNRFIVEIYKSQSSQVSQFFSADQLRLASYLDAIDGYHAWVVSQPQLDLPETSPRVYVLKAAPAVTDTENDEVDNLIRLFELTRDELINSQSARQGSGFIPFDSVRLTAIVSKAREFLNTFVQQSTPLDLPESSPQTPTMGSGIGGI